MCASFYPYASDIDCCICFQSMKEGDVDVVAHSGEGYKHPMHRACMKAWADVHPSCPLCRNLIDVNSLYWKEKRVASISQDTLLRILSNVYFMVCYKISKGISLSFGDCGSEIENEQLFKLIITLVGATVIFKNGIDYLNADREKRGLHITIVGAFIFPVLGILTNVTTTAQTAAMASLLGVVTFSIIGEFLEESIVGDRGSWA